MGILQDPRDLRPRPALHSSSAHWRNPRIPWSSLYSCAPSFLSECPGDPPHLPFSSPLLPSWFSEAEGEYYVRKSVKRGLRKQLSAGLGVRRVMGRHKPQICCHPACLPTFVHLLPHYSFPGHILLSISSLPGPGPSIKSA